MSDHRRAKTHSVNKSRPCPVCSGTTSNCTIVDDGFIMCRKRTGEQPGFVFMGTPRDDKQWGEYRRVGDPVLEEKDRQWREAHPQSNTNGKAEKPIDWSGLAKRFQADLTPELRQTLATELGVPVESLALLGAGWKKGEQCWTFPERDAAGQIIGINRRYRDGAKMLMKDGKRGLYITPNWKDENGPLLLPEGASDVLALSTMGFSAVGRPNNTGGANLLAGLLKGISADREIIVLGERDIKDNGDWPGKDGAVGAAASLSQALKRMVAWCLPPDGAKDIRAWYKSLPDKTNAAERLLSFLNTHKSGKYDPSAGQNARGGDGASADTGYRFVAIDSKTFFTTDYRLEWLVRRLIVRGQPLVAGGPKKTLKTSTLVDLAVSLGTATPFLGHFDVYKRHRVVIVSGESGEAVLQECGRRVCAARGVNPEELSVWWSFRLPQVANVLDRIRLRDGLKELEASVVILDPLYLCLLAGMDQEKVEAGNLYQMGPLLSDMCRACLDAGCTPMLSHHAKKGSGKSYEPLDLDDLSFAGIAEFARQWILESRREPFDPNTGSSKLWLSVGGSAGQSGCWAVDVEEGVLREDFTGRTWEVTVRTSSEEHADSSQAKHEQKSSQQSEQIKRDGTAVLLAIDRLTKKEGKAVYTQVRAAAHLTPERMTRAVLDLTEQGHVEEYMVTIQTGKNLKVEREAKGLRRTVGL
jgi:AAA domain